jgi:heme exporter protein B
MKTLAMAWRLMKKDFRIEMRSGDITITTVLFGVILTVMVSMSFYFDRVTATRMASGVLWIAIAFSGVLVMTRIWGRERDHDVIRGLLIAPIPRAAIYFGKAGAAFVFLAIVELVLLPLVTVFFQVDLWPILDKVAALLVLGTIGFTATGTLFSAMTVEAKGREFIFTMIFFPLISPALLAGVVGTRDAIMGASWDALSGWFMLLGAFAIIGVGAALALFEALMSD